MAFKRLRKQLNLLDVFALSIGPMLASGIFLLPGIVFRQVGPAAVITFLLAGILILPSLFSKAELATAMPRAGGTYYFMHRSMGPAVGTIAGLGTWLALIFKSAFALIGLGAYLVLLVDLPMKPVAVGLCILFMALGISGVKSVGNFQGILVGLLLGMLAYFITLGFTEVDPTSFKPFFRDTGASFLSTVGLVYVGFTGITKVVSVAEEVDNLRRNIPLGMILAIIVTLVIYVLGIYIMVGVTPADVLAQTLTPVTDAARYFLGDIGVKIMTVAAILAFTAAANAGLTAASRYPMAMSRDALAPAFFKRVSKQGTPIYSIILTTAIMLVFILMITPTGIAKLASAFQLLLFGMINLAVIVMRESGITSYDPDFRSPLYPWMQVIGILTTIVLIPELGFMSVLFSGLLIGLSLLWYMFYVKKRSNLGGAMLHMFQRMGEKASPDVDQELRTIMKEKGLKDQSSFQDSLKRAEVLHHKEGETIDQLLWRASEKLSQRLRTTDEEIYNALLSTSRLGDTPIGKHIALPHARIHEAKEQEVAIIHSRYGIEIEGTDELIFVVFVLISPHDAPRKHLRFLAELANRAEAIDFSEEWRHMTDDHQIKRMFRAD